MLSCAKTKPLTTRLQTPGAAEERKGDRCPLQQDTNTHTLCTRYMLHKSHAQDTHTARPEPAGWGTVKQQWGGMLLYCTSKTERRSYERRRKKKKKLKRREQGPPRTLFCDNGVLRGRKKIIYGGCGTEEVGPNAKGQDASSSSLFNRPSSGGGLAYML